jgi:hypothetical protein
MPPELSVLLEDANVVLTACFTAEMVMKMVAYGCHKYFSDPFSRFDAVVVFVRFAALEPQATLAGP